MWRKLLHIKNYSEGKNFLCFESFNNYAHFLSSLSLIVSKKVSECGNVIQVWFRRERERKNGNKKIVWQVMFFYAEKVKLFLFSAESLWFWFFSGLAYGECAGTPACHKYDNTEKNEREKIEKLAIFEIYVCCNLILHDEKDYQENRTNLDFFDVTIRLLSISNKISFSFFHKILNG